MSSISTTVVPQAVQQFSLRYLPIVNVGRMEMVMPRHLVSAEQ